MTLDTLIALLGIILGVIALMPRGRQLDLLIRIHTFHIVISIVLYLVISLLIIFGLGTLAYFVTLISICIVYYSLQKDDLEYTKIFKVRELILELFREDRFPELFSIMEKQFDWIIQIQSNEEDDFRSEQEEARELIWFLSSSEKFVSKIAEYNPSLGIQFLDVRNWYSQSFMKLYLVELIKNKQSVLYQEIVNYYNSSRITEKDLFLSFLFSDISVADRFGVWRPIGQFVNYKLEELGESPEKDPYNQRMIDFKEAGRWESDIYIGIMFFDIMITFALNQKKYKNHMWLYFYSYFVKKIVNNFSIDGDYYGRNSEWGSRYSYLIYQIIINVGNWLRRSKGIQLQDGNIPFSSIRVLSGCIRTIIMSQNIPMELKRGHVMDLVFDLYFIDFKKNPDDFKGYDEFFLESLFEFTKFDDNDMEARFINEIGELFKHQDKTHYRSEHINEFNQRLGI